MESSAEKIFCVNCDCYTCYSDKGELFNNPTNGTTIKCYCECCPCAICGEIYDQLNENYDGTFTEKIITVSVKTRKVKIDDKKILNNGISNKNNKCCNDMQNLKYYDRQPNGKRYLCNICKAYVIFETPNEVVEEYYEVSKQKVTSNLVKFMKFALEESQNEKYKDLDTSEKLNAVARTWNESNNKF